MEEMVVAQGRGEEGRAGEEQSEVERERLAIDEDAAAVGERVQSGADPLR